MNTQTIERSRSGALVDGQAIDREIAEKHPSSCCDVPCTYRAEHSEDGYRAFAVCSKCGQTEEF